MAESPCPYCEKPVSYDEGRLAPQAVTFGPRGGTFPESKTREATCPHCGEPIIRAEVEAEEAVWHRDNRAR
jgi:endogenous inhibitor of DNA gyrase (YacG/DUF329 family)